MFVNPRSSNGRTKVFGALYRSSNLRWGIIMKSIVHVNQHRIKSNQKYNENLPVITIKKGGKTLYAWGVVFQGSSKLEYHETDPLSCGARVWISTEEPIILLDINNEPFDGLGYNESKLGEL